MKKIEVNSSQKSYSFNEEELSEQLLIFVRITDSWFNMKSNSLLLSGVECRAFLILSKDSEESILNSIILEINLWKWIVKIIFVTNENFFQMIIHKKINKLKGS